MPSIIRSKGLKPHQNKICVNIFVFVLHYTPSFGFIFCHDNIKAGPLR